MDRHRGHFVSLQLRCLRWIQSLSHGLLLQSLSLYQAWVAVVHPHVSPKISVDSNAMLVHPHVSPKFSGDSNAMLLATMTQLRLGWTRANIIEENVIRKLLNALSQPPKSMCQPHCEALCHHHLVLLILGSSQDRKAQAIRGSSQSRKVQVSQTVAQHLPLLQHLWRQMSLPVLKITKLGCSTTGSAQNITSSVRQP